MASQQHPSASVQVFVRWRPISASESSAPEIRRSITQNDGNQTISLSVPSSSSRSTTWNSGASFNQVFPASAINSTVYKSVVAPTLPQIINGATCNFFAYGHSGSGKTHTIIGYNYEDTQQLGLCLAAARDLFRAIDEISGKESKLSNNESLCVAVRLYEIRGKCAYDLLNEGNICHVREGSDGQTHIRGQTEVLDGGKVRVRPVVARPCWTFNELRETFLAGLALRKVGSSTVHEESSRTHAVLELEVVNRELLEARDEVTERESELVPIGKRATDIYLEEQMASLIRTPQGDYVQNPERPLNQERIDAAEAEKSKYVARLKEAENAVQQCFKNSQHSCLGGKFVFVDLAGSEYFDRGSSTSIAGAKQTPQERQQGRQINTDLFALKEVIRARALNQVRIPFRSSPLTMILRNHFLATNRGQSAMILTVAPCEAQFAATVNTLKYGNLVGRASNTA